MLKKRRQKDRNTRMRVYLCSEIRATVGGNDYHIYNYRNELIT